ncbi:MAG: TIGR03364 family FAD-dependent oxidoreductase [Planctomycetota bacterium]|nr:TIGR03364 family FAD-dependent oxidoreductase [Planctomycetota bacterium]
MKTNQSDVIIVGAGILGIACAYEAAKRGLRVTVLERDKEARGASIRNFGMIWPTGLTAEVLPLAKRSVATWKSVATAAHLWTRTDGCIYLAASECELQVMREFVAVAPERGYSVKWLEKAQVLERSPSANPESVLGGFSSDLEMCVDPPETMRRLPIWLRDTYGVDFRFRTQVGSIEMPLVCCTDGSRFTAPRVIVATGDQSHSLFPEVFEAQHIETCKMQMMQTVEQPRAWDFGPMMATGLSLRHYDSMQGLPTIDQLRGEVAARAPELDRYGIHVLAAQHADGSVCIGDSHEFADAAEDPFDKEIVNEMIMREFRRYARLRDFTIEYRWVGRQVRNRQRVIVCEEPQPGCRVLIGAGNSGMTLAFGHAEDVWNGWLGPHQP